MDKRLDPDDVSFQEPKVLKVKSFPVMGSSLDAKFIAPNPSQEERVYLKVLAALINSRASIGSINADPNKVIEDLNSFAYRMTQVAIPSIRKLENTVLFPKEQESRNG